MVVLDAMWTRVLYNSTVPNVNGLIKWRNRVSLPPLLTKLVLISYTNAKRALIRNPHTWIILLLIDGLLLQVTSKITKA